MTHDAEQTRIGVLRAEPAVVPDRRVHYLQVVTGQDIGRRFVIDASEVRIGRTPPAEVVLPDSEVSRVHCSVSLRGDDLIITDMNSTNGTYIDGARVSGAAVARVGSIIQIGSHTLRHDSREARDMAQRLELDRDLEKANAYVQSLLPAPVASGPVLCDWIYLPSAKLGGDAFGYGQIDDQHHFGYLIDVAGHGAGAAMHTVSVLNVLRRKALPGADMLDPASVLSALNEMFQMDNSGGMYFTIWYGVFNLRTRKLKYASAGHPPAFLTTAGGEEIRSLRTSNPIIGAIEGLEFLSADIDLPPGASLYVFSDGVFEITDREGREWTLKDFERLVAKGRRPESTEPRRLLHEVQTAAQPGGFDDDFTLLVLTFQN